jgi:hypothetical protein
MGYFVVEFVQRFLYERHPSGEQFALFLQNFLAGVSGAVSFFEKRDIFKQGIYRDARLAHTFDEINPLAIRFGIVPNAAFVPRYRRD